MFDIVICFACYLGYKDNTTFDSTKFIFSREQKEDRTPVAGFAVLHLTTRSSALMCGGQVTILHLMLFRHTLIHFSYIHNYAQALRFELRQKVLEALVLPLTLNLYKTKTPTGLASVSMSSEHRVTFSPRVGY
jgi:hypothetical protein